MARIEVVYQEAVNCFYAGKLGDAERLFRKTLRKLPRHEGALNLLTVTLMSAGRVAEAEEFARQAASLPATSDATYSNYGLILKKLKKPEEALDQFDRALRLNAANAETWNNRGATLNDLHRYEEACESLDKAIALDPNFAGAYCNRGKAHCELGRFDTALRDCDKSVALRPDLAEAWCGRAYVLSALWRKEEALANHRRALALNPGLAVAWGGQGMALAELGSHEEAFAAFGKAIGIEPELPEAAGLRLGSKMHCCDWDDLEAEIGRIVAAVRDGRETTPPFQFLAVSDSPADQLSCARIFVAAQGRGDPGWNGPTYTHDRIRVGYLSTDLRMHAVAQLIAGVFECHDRSRFEITGLSLARDDGSEMRQRLRASFDRFVDVADRSDEDLAGLIRSLEIDVLVDLNGFTSGGRWNILARRPAPVQVNYLGYPGTMGAPYVDYIVADPVLIPERDREFYSEKVCLLPDSYQANDARRKIADREFSRGELGLPEQGFVFCCFNNNYKITPDVFDVWMKILGAVPGSVLWLFEGNAAAVRNLRREAARRGIDEGRLVFAGRMPVEDHLARHRCADLFLDTLPYNAHTTASDALWAGVPVLTRIGSTFAGRVAASLLAAVGLPELAVQTRDEYQALAIELATNPSKLSQIRQRLADQRATAPLFDTARFTRNIEAAYRQMHGRHQAGLAPDHIRVEAGAG